MAKEKAGEILEAALEKATEMASELSPAALAAISTLSVIGGGGVLGLGGYGIGR